MASLQSISVIIAARNEAENLPRLLGSLAALDYPRDLFEIVLVSDHSTD
ncbi:MAG TPA: glycosyltransferase, partial [Candidatus Cloacimonadota bacterium]|nr:glycosyltransferase [Candidatus Cloacimonadota bacterium]